MKTWTKILTVLVAVETLLMAILCCSKLEINSNSASVLISSLSVLVTFVVAWQIWQTINAKKEIESARREMENSCDKRLDDFNKKMRRDKIFYVNKAQELDKKLEEQRKSINDTVIMKYYLNDAMGSMHYNDGRMIEGVLDVIENIYLIVTNRELFEKHFGNEYSDKLGVATYFIAKNLKMYKQDQIVKDSNKERLIKRLENINNRWTKRFYGITDKFQVIGENKTMHSFVFDRLKKLDGILNRLVVGVKKSGINYIMPTEDTDTLNQMAGN